MCGFVGFIDRKQSFNQQALETIAKQMSDCLKHRGPDDGGVWTNPQAGLAFGFRRLAIIDISHEGHQPMISQDGRYVIIFNGEIYNFQAIRDELAASGWAPSWRGHSDTEVMLAAFSAWGVEKAVAKFNGMFGFALWDQESRILHLGRDRIGQKPVYYGWIGDSFMFGSELKSFRPHPDWEGTIYRGALALFLRYNYIPGPYSIYQNIYKLPAGCLLSLDPSHVSAQQLPTPRQYWSMREIAETGDRSPLDGPPEEILTSLDALLRDAVRLRMIADVPLGAFLSGGIDSSIITALMQAQSNRPVKTFSIGFREEEFDEAQYAKAVAQHLGTDHTELYVSPTEAREVIPKLPLIFDEPFSDPSQIPTYLVSKLARQELTVALSGDGGDEFFGGYSRYFTLLRWWNKLQAMPQTIRQTAGHTLSLVPPTTWSTLAGVTRRIFPENIARRFSAGEVSLLHKSFLGERPEPLYNYIFAHWRRPEQIVIDGVEPTTINHLDASCWGNFANLLHHATYLDSVSYLPDDILVKVDRASMAVSLEARAPFLDYRLVEFSWRVPPALKIREGEGKWLLKQLLYRYVPRTLVDRPKMGFGVPIHKWLAGPLREWTEALIDKDRLREEGFFAVEPIHKRWAEHLAGKYNWGPYLWDILMFQAWLETQQTEPTYVINAHTS